MAIYLLILPVRFLISVIRAFILVFDASETALCFLSLPFCFLISVIRADMHAFVKKPKAIGWLLSQDLLWKL